MEENTPSVLLTLDGHYLEAHYGPYDDSGVARLELKDDNEISIIDNLFRSNDFWAQFLGSLSAALGRHR